MVTAGALTYPLYLLHNQIGRVLLELAPVSWPQWLAQSVAGVIVYAMAWALATLIERRGCSAFQSWMMRRAVTLRLVRST
jgi:peptidoglycan/LPS O-acetylase OafA/YrhL